MTIGNVGDTLVVSLNRLAATTALVDEPLAANLYAGTTGLAMLDALNRKAGNTLPNYRDLPAVLNQLAGTSGLDAVMAAWMISTSAPASARNLVTEGGDQLTTESGNHLTTE